MSKQRLLLYYKFYQLIKFLYAVIRNFPKEYKYTLGGDILKLFWQCLGLVAKSKVICQNNVGQLKEKFFPRLNHVFLKLRYESRA